MAIASLTYANDILLLNSYHKGHRWTDDITAGVFAVLYKADPLPQIHTEYMDIARFNGKTYERQFTQWLKSKYQNTRFKVIIAFDDPAVIYLKKVRDKLFPNTPVVFCGSNRLRKMNLTNLEGFTGVIEKPDIISNLELMVSLHPNIQHIYIISDHNQMDTDGLQSLSDAIATIKEKEKISLHLLQNVILSHLVDKVKQFSVGDAVLYATARNNGGDSEKEQIQKLKSISKWSRVPVYGVLDCYLNYGIVGGRLINGVKEGNIVAQIALKVINSDALEKKTIVSLKPIQYMFDHNQMKRFAIVADRLPPKSTIINQPRSIYTEYRTVIIVVLIGVFGLHFIIAALILNILKFRRAEANMLKTQRRFNTILETAKEGFVEIDTLGIVRDVNPEMCILIGLSRQKIIDQPIFTFLTSSSSLQLKHHLRLAHAGARCTFEVTISHVNQEEIYCLFNMTPIFDEQQNSIGCFAMVSDVTELKMAESALQK
ncbi:MAG: PAS domain S-box protein, partial [Desulfobacteraceae bacterium]